jgi:hypothetical protein
MQAAAPERAALQQACAQLDKRMAEHAAALQEGRGVACGIALHVARAAVKAL